MSFELDVDPFEDQPIRRNGVAVLIQRHQFERHLGGFGLLRLQRASDIQFEIESLLDAGRRGRLTRGPGSFHAPGISDVTGRSEAVTAQLLS
jgi:hypothetical protein